MTGKLIVFEGVEGSGKTTQLRALEDWLHTAQIKQQPVVVTREPGGTSLGKGLRQLLLEGEAQIQDRAELLLYAADRAQHVEEFLKPQLARGAIILCDRYTDSTVAYQGYGRGLSLDLIAQLNQIATQGLQAEVTLWLDVDAEIGLARARTRGMADRIEQADLAFHQRVQQGFCQLAVAHRQRIVRIDAHKSQEEVHLAVLEILRQRLGLWS
jgi:dTMP kinase